MSSILSYRCNEFLDLLHIPAVLSPNLVNKLTSCQVGLDKKFKIAEAEGKSHRLVSCADLCAFDDIWVLPHTHLTTRSRLYGELRDDASLRQSLIRAFDLPTQTSHGELFEAYWSWCFGCTLGLEDGGDSSEELRWHVEAPELLAIPHADAPNVIVRALPAVIYEMCKSDVFKKGASIVCLGSSVASGQILKRDMLPKKRTRSRIARLLALIGDAPDRWAHTAELAGLQQLNQCASPLLAKNYEVAKPPVRKSDIRPLAAMTEFTPAVRKVFSDYPAVHTCLTHPGFEKVGDFDSSNILFAASPVASFNSLGRRLVNQFPRECYLLSPRLLLHAVRSEHHGQGDPKQQAVVIGTSTSPCALLPEWFPLSFDLKTEVKLFLEIKEQLPDPWWILVSGEAGAEDWCVTSKSKTVIKYMEANDANWVVQKLMPQPFLYKGRKVMMSTFLLVCSMEPVDVYLYKQAYGTVASLEYSLDAAFLANETVHLPFEDPSQTVLPYAEFIKLLESEGLELDQLMDKLTSIVRELLQSVGRQIGPSQRSRALYRLDFRLPAIQKGVPFQPQLAKAVFAPNLDIPLKSNAAFVNQVFELLFLNGDAPADFIPINDGAESESDATDVSESPR